MDPVEQVQEIVDAWDQDDDGQAPSSPHRDKLTRMAWLALRVIVPKCGQSHPQRAAIVCDQESGHGIGHGNDRVQWYDDGRTIHVDLGYVALVPDPDGDTMASADAEDDQASPGGPDTADDLLETLRLAQAALGRVEMAYYETTSKRITGPILRPVRLARERVEQSVTSLTAAIGVVRARG